MGLPHRYGGKVPAGVSILRYTRAQWVVILVPCSGMRCSLEAQERGAGGMLMVEALLYSGPGG